MAKKQPKKPAVEVEVEKVAKRYREPYHATAGPETLANLAWIGAALGLPNRSVVIDFIAAQTRRQMEAEIPKYKPGDLYVE